MGEGTTTRRTVRTVGMNGVLVGGITAVISGISVFANSYGVHHVPSPSVYTTGKNLVAFLALGAGAQVAFGLVLITAGTVLVAWRMPRHVVAT